MKTNLTDVSLRALKPPPKGQLTIWDKTSPLGVRVSQGGSKTFILIIGSGKRRTLGRFGIVTLSNAREESNQHRPNNARRHHHCAFLHANPASQ